jgi:nitrogen-specific signal transduction histidine kinase
MSAFQLIPLFAALVNFALAGFVCTQNLRLRANQVFLLCAVSLGVWNFGASSLFRVTDPHLALFCARLTMVGVIWIPVAFFHVTLLITKSRTPPIVLRLAYAATFVIAALAFSPWFVSEVRQLKYGAWFSVAGPVFYCFAVLVFPALVIPTFVLLIRRFRRAARVERRRLGSLLAADTLLCVFGLHDMGPLYGYGFYPGTNVPIYPWGSLAASVYGLIIGNALLQDQLLDMRISLGRQAATFLRLMFLLATAYILLAVCALIVPNSFSIASFIVSLLALALAAPMTAYFFPRLLGAKSERLEMRILGDRFEYHDQVRRFIGLIPSYTELDKLMADTRDVFSRTIRLASFELFAIDPRSHAVRKSTVEPASDAPPLETESPLIDLFLADAKLAYLDCRNPGPSLWDHHAVTTARAALAPRNPDIVFPIRTSEGNLIGLLLCGTKDLGIPITAHDLELVLVICQQLGYAFERMHLAEQAAVSERLETLTWMSRGLAHDLPNAVMPITTFLELQGESIPAEDERYPLLQLAKRNTANILAYAHEAMFFVHDFQLRYAPIDIIQLLENVIVSTASRAERRGVKVQTIISSEVSFEGDALLLQRLIGNLVSNACDASPRDAIVIIHYFPLPDTRTRAGWVRFEVIDRGTGIAPEHLNHIFDPYYSTKQVGDVTRGFGLGLTIAQKIVLLHQGTISVKSEVGTGTTFTVDLPPRNPNRETPAA